MTDFATLRTLITEAEAHHAEPQRWFAALQLAYAIARHVDAATRVGLG